MQKDVVKGVTAVCRVVLAVIVLVATICLVWCLGLQIYRWLDAQGAALKWLTAAVTAAAGGSVVVAAQALPTFLENLTRLMRSLVCAWSEFGLACWAIVKTSFAPVLLFVFATVFIAEEAIRVPVIDQDALIRRMDQKLIGPMRNDIKRVPQEVAGKIGGAMTDQGYTPERATLLDHLALLYATKPIGYYIARFPILFEGARLPEGLDVNDVDVSRVEFASGVQVSKEGGDLIKNLVKALAPCGEGDRRVGFRVEGYASSQPFQGFSPEDSKTLNLRAARTRGKNVRDALDAAISEWPDRFNTVDLAKYSDLEDMEVAREFDDRSGVLGQLLGKALEQDVMTRAAHIKVMHAGACATETPTWGIEGKI